MKKTLALILSAIMLASLAACSGSGSSSKDEGSKTDSSIKTESSGNAESADKTDAPTTTAATTAAQQAAADVSSWTWVKGELDCYGYDDCYLSYEVPEQFASSEQNDSGLQTRSYYNGPSANESPYGVYITFGQGTFGGATKSSLEENISSGLTERELGGRTVLFGEYPTDPNTGSHAFAYYTAYSEDEYARIWIILCDPEADGEFRKTFEQSMNFIK